MLYWISQQESTTSDTSLEDTVSLIPHVKQPVRLSGRVGIFRALLTTLFVLFVIIETARIYHASTNPRPRIPLDDNMQVTSYMRNESLKLGLKDGYRLLVVNQKVVVDDQDMKGAFTYTQGSTEHLVFETNPEGEDQEKLDLFWRETSEYPQFECDADGRLISGPPESDDFHGLKVISANGAKVENNEDLQNALTHEATYTAALNLVNDSGEEILLGFSVANWAARTTTLIAGILVGATALTVSWIRGASIGAWGFVLFGLNMGIFSISRSIPFDYRLTFESATYFVAQVTLIATGAVFLVSFASLRVLAEQKLSRSWALGMLLLGAFAAYIASKKTLTYVETTLHEEAKWVFIAVWIPAIILAANMFISKHKRISTTKAIIVFGIAVTVMLGSASAFFFSNQASVGILGMPFFYVWQIYTLTLITLCLVSNLILKWSGVPVPMLDRRRSKILLVSMLCSFLPMTIYVLLRMSFIQNLTSGRPFMEFAQVIFPISIAYGIVKQNILQMSRFFLEALAYVFLLTAGFISYVLVGTFLTSTNSQTGQSIIASAFVMTAMASILLVLHTFASKKFTSWGRYTPEAEEEFLDSLHDMAVNAKSVNELYEFVDKELRETLQVTNVDLLLTTELFKKTDQPRSVVAENIDGLENGQAILAIASNEANFFVRDLEDQIDPQTIQFKALDALHGLSSDLVVTVRNKTQVIGTLSLGIKIGGTNFTDNELGFLRRLSRRLGTSLLAVIDREQDIKPRRIIDLFPRFPSKIEDYAIQGVLGQGGMSYVYLGERRGQLAALKVANHRVQLNSMLRSRFVREWEILSTIPHPRIVRLLNHGQFDSEPYMAFEFMEKGSLADVLRQNGRLESGKAIPILRDVIEGLEHALKHGVIHRDLKPHNLYLDNQQSAKISDFGAARIEDDDQFTMTGEIIGTLAYMAPERLNGHPGDWRADQYALGVTAYELLTGTKPFMGRTLEAQLVSKMNWSAANLGELTDHADIDTCQTITKMMLPDANRRFGSYDELLKILT
jgi:hypothetical protein